MFILCSTTLLYKLKTFFHLGIKNKFGTPKITLFICVRTLNSMDSLTEDSRILSRDMKEPRVIEISEDIGIGVIMFKEIWVD